MIEPLRAWMLLQQLRSHIHNSPQQLKTLQDSLFREAVLHAYEYVPFYRSFWDQEGFDPRGVRGTQDLPRVPIMTWQLARSAAAQGELLARNLHATQRTLLSTTGSTGHPLRITRGRGEERLWRAQGLRIWFEQGYRWRDKKVQFDLHAGTPHFLQRLGISRTRWISPDVTIEELRDRFLQAKADWVIGTPTVLRRLANALAATDGHFPHPRAVFCQGELVDRHTRDLIRRVFGLTPVDVYTTTEIGYVAWQCERGEGLHVNADTHLVEVLRTGEAVRPGELGKVVVTDLRNRAMPFLRYETGDLAIAGSGACGCGRRFPCLQSIEGRQRDALHLKDGRIVTARALVDHLGKMFSPDEYRLYQETANRFLMELSAGAGQVGDTGTHEQSSLRNSEMIEKHLRALLGDVEIYIQTARTTGESGVKTYPIVVKSPVPIA